MKQVTKNVYIETSHEGCNHGFVTTKEGIVMIDAPMLPTDAMKWREEVNKKGKVRYIVNTDPHIDHFLSIPFFDGVVISHEGTREQLLKFPFNERLKRITNGDPKQLPLMEGYKLADITFTESLNLYLGDHTFKLLHLPGHNVSLVGVYIPEERLVFASDCIFFKVRSYMYESIPDKWLESLKVLNELDVDVLVPGHGDDVCRKEYTKEQANIIRQWVDSIKTAIKQGLTVEEAATKMSCPDPHRMFTGHITESDLNKAIIARLYKVLSPCKS
jgi:cyclase